MRSLLLSAAIAAVAAAGVRGQGAGNSSTFNNRPIIGILSLPSDNPGYTNTSYFPASYVKWLEAAGARVVPIPYTMPAAELSTLLGSLNGALFTGGGANFFNPDGSMTQFTIAAQTIFNESVAAAGRGETWPLWGTCMGHELISVLAAQNASTLTGGFDSENLTLPLQLESAAFSSRMMGKLPPNVLSILAKQPVTMNNHMSGVTPQDFAASAPLASRFTVLSTNCDRQGREFVSAMEGNSLPIYSTQFHPEKPQFEWNPAEVINHDADSILANHYFALFFVNQARLNRRSFPTVAAESAALIYNYSPVYTEATDPSFEQCYFLPVPPSKQ